VTNLAFAASFACRGGGRGMRGVVTYPLKPMFPAPGGERGRAGGGDEGMRG